MKRTEGIEVLEEARKRYPGKSVIRDAFTLAINILRNPLRGPTRETVKRMFPGCEMCLGWNSLKLKPCANGDLGVQADIGSVGKEDPFGLVVYNHHLASGYVDFPFCPFCGKPKTDRAVDMMLERWKEAVADEA